LKEHSLLRRSQRIKVFDVFHLHVSFRRAAVRQE
jgi:hypothetical protein